MNPAFRFAYRAYQAAFRLAWIFIDLREPTLLSGPGSLQKLPEIVKNGKIASVLLVTDAGLTAAGLTAKVSEGFAQHDIRVAIYDGTVPNPTIANVEDALTLYHSSGAQAIVALGGGSPMDVAKAVGARVAKPRRTVEQMRGVLRVGRPLPPLFAIPTTAGTGSETTLAAVIVNPATHAKFAINDPVLVPALAVLDPRLTISLPPRVTAATGIDALTHAVEAYIGRSNTAKTRKNAREAVRLVFANLRRAYADGTDLEARGAMQRAAFAAGAAFTRAYVGNVHAIAHTLGGYYGVPHGLANAVVLPHVLDFYGDRIAPKLAELGRVAGLSGPGEDARQVARRFIAAIRTLNADLGIPERFPGVIQAKDLDAMITHAMREANPLYPVPTIMGRSEFRSIYEKLM